MTHAFFEVLAVLRVIRTHYVKDILKLLDEVDLEGEG